eukprot:scaffold137819_cov39-Tisochrysis_lutea.AAC.1
MTAYHGIGQIGGAKHHPAVSITEEYEEHRPFPKGPVPLYWPPVTAPEWRTCVHGVWIMPPSQPEREAQKQMSCAESGTIILPPVAIHIRSDAASAPANAQQQPQFDWSRISPMTDGDITNSQR